MKLKYYLKGIAVINVLLAATSIVTPSAAAKCEGDWSSLKTAWKAYVSHAESKTADALLEQLKKNSQADKAANSTCRERTEAIATFPSSIDKIERHFDRPKLRSIEILIALLSYSDAGFTQELWSSIGKGGEIDPLTFLQNLARYNKAESCPFIDDVDPYEELQNPSEYDPLIATLQKRKNGINRIADPSVKTAKAICIKSLNEKIAEYTQLKNTLKKKQ